MSYVIFGVSVWRPQGFPLFLVGIVNLFDIVGLLFEVLSYNEQFWILCLCFAFVI